MKKMKLKFFIFATLAYLLVGLISNFASGYLIVHYYYLSKAKWYFADIVITLLNIIGLSFTLIFLIKKTADIKKIFLYRFFLAMGLLGLFLLVILRFYFQMEIPNFPPKLTIASLSIDGIIIKIILDQKITYGDLKIGGHIQL